MLWSSDTRSYTLLWRFITLASPSARWKGRLCTGQLLNSLIKWLGRYHMPGPFTYLGSMLNNEATIDHEVDAWIKKAQATYDRLHRIWKQHEICLWTKIKVVNAAVLTTLLYGCETWTCYEWYIKKFDSFHLSRLQQLLGSKRQVSNIDWWKLVWLASRLIWSVPNWNRLAMQLICLRSLYQNMSCTVFLIKHRQS